MSEHQITIEVGRFKMDMYEDAYRWSCSCGRRSDAIFGYRGHAEAAGNAHATAKQAH